MSLDDVISTGGDFIKSIVSFGKSRKMVYTAIAGTLGIGGWGYNDIKNHINVIESTPAYRNGVDSTLKVVNQKIMVLDSINKQNTIAVDSLKVKTERNNKIEYRVNENMDLIDLMYEDYYDFKYKIDYRVQRLEH